MPKLTELNKNRGSGIKGTQVEDTMDDCVKNNESSKEDGPFVCNCWLCCYLKRDEDVLEAIRSPRTKSTIKEIVPETLSKADRSLRINDSRPTKGGLVAEYTKGSDIKINGEAIDTKCFRRSNNIITNVDKVDSSISYFNLSKILGYKGASMENSSKDLHMFLKDLDPRSDHSLASARLINSNLNSKDKQEKFLSAFSKDQTVNYLCQVCKGNPRIHGIQCFNLTRKIYGSEDINCVFGGKAASETLTFGETIRTECERSRHNFLFESTYLKKSKHTKETVGDASDVGSIFLKKQYSPKIGECTKRTEGLTITKSDINISSNNNIKLVSDNLLSKDVNKMENTTSTLNPKDLWIDIKVKTDQNDSELVNTETGEVLENVTFDINSYQKKDFSDTSANAPFYESKRSNQERKKNENAEDELKIPEKWKTTKMAWKPSDESLDKKFFVTFPGIAFNVKDTKIRYYEDWRDAILNNYVLRHSELNSILTVRTFDFLLQDLVKKRLMVRTRKGLKTVKSRRMRERKKGGQKYQTLESDIDEGVTRDDVIEVLPSNNVKQGIRKSAKCSETNGKVLGARKRETKKKKRRCTQTRNKNIFMGYICMEIVRRFSKNILIF